MEISIRKYLVAFTLVLALVQVSSVHSVKMPETMYIKNLSGSKARVVVLEEGKECRSITVEPYGHYTIATLLGCKNADQLSFRVGGGFSGVLDVSKIEYKGSIKSAIVEIEDVSIPSDTAKREVFVRFYPVGEVIDRVDLEPAGWATR
jgi:hypothetical protein